MRFTKNHIPWSKGKHHSETTKKKISLANKGKRPTEETRKKLSESKIGHITSEETKRKISDAQKGVKNHNFGKHPSDETRHKRSLALKGKSSWIKGKHHSDEWKLKMSERMMGHLVSEETRKKLHNSNIGKHHTEETKKKISELQKGKIPWNKGKQASMAHRHKLSESHKGKKMSEELKLKQSEKMKGNKYRLGIIDSEETKKLKSESMMNYYRYNPNSSETKRKISEVHKGKKLSEQHKQKLKLVRAFIVIPNKDTSIEVKLQTKLTNLGYTYKKHFPIFGQPDIAFPNEKIAVFADGDYWHGPKRPDVQSRDKLVNETLIKQGWIVLRYWEYEINKYIDDIIDEIEDVLFLSNPAPQIKVGQPTIRQAMSSNGQMTTSAVKEPPAELCCA